MFGFNSYKINKPNKQSNDYEKCHFNSASTSYAH